MGWFSPIKGGYPSLSQIDKTLPVDASSTGITRGTVIEVVEDTTGMSADGVFKIATGSSEPGLLYIALQDYEDAQAGMAGTTGFDEGVIPSDFPGKGMTANPGVPTITGLALSMEGEYETDNYTGLESAKVGDKLVVTSGGKFTVAGDSDTDFVAYLTATPYSRWINNLNVKPANATRFNAVRQGGTANVIRFRTK